MFFERRFFEKEAGTIFEPMHIIGSTHSSKNRAYPGLTRARGPHEPDWSETPNITRWVTFLSHSAAAFATQEERTHQRASLNSHERSEHCRGGGLFFATRTATFLFLIREPTLFAQHHLPSSLLPFFFLLPRSSGCWRRSQKVPLSVKRESK